MTWMDPHGSADPYPDPHQNVMDSQHWVKNLPSMKEPEGRLARNGQVRSPWPRARSHVEEVAFSSRLYEGENRQSIKKMTSKTVNKYHHLEYGCPSSIFANQIPSVMFAMSSQAILAMFIQKPLLHLIKNFPPQNKLWHFSGIFFFTQFS